MKAKIGFLLLSVLINAAVTVFLLWQYDRRFSPRFYVVDVSGIAQDYAKRVAEGKMSVEDVEKELKDLYAGIGQIVNSQRALILRKEAVIGGEVAVYPQE